MIRAFIFLSILLNAYTTLGQRSSVSNDSSRLIFSNNVAIDFSKTSRKGRRVYELTPLAMRTLFVQCRYLEDLLDLSRTQQQLHEKESMRKDSTIQILKEQLMTTNERLLVFASGYEKMKAVSASYDRQTNQLITDLEHVSKRNRRANQKKFLEGLAVGLAVTVVYVVLND